MEYKNMAPPSNQTILWNYFKSLFPANNTSRSDFLSIYLIIGLCTDVSCPYWELIVPLLGCGTAVTQVRIVYQQEYHPTSYT